MISWRNVMLAVLVSAESCSSLTTADWCRTPLTGCEGWSAGATRIHRHPPTKESEIRALNAVVAVSRENRVISDATGVADLPEADRSKPLHINRPDEITRPCFATVNASAPDPKIRQPALAAQLQHVVYMARIERALTMYRLCCE